MLRLIFAFGISFCYLVQLQAQDHKTMLIGKWEDKASNNETSFQFVVHPDTVPNQFIFDKVPQAKITARNSFTYDEIYKYRWVNDSVIAYAKLPNANKVKAAMYPPLHTLMRIDEISKNKLKISFSDLDLPKKQIDSLIEAGNLNQHFGKRSAEYTRLNLAKAKKDLLALGLWEDPNSNDSVSFQLFIQKGQLGFLKLDKEEQLLPTQIKPNKGYNYKWINDHVFYYWRQAPTGYVIQPQEPTEYSMMRVELVNRKKLIVTLSTRPFNKAGIDYLVKKGNLNDYFLDNQKIYRRIDIVEEDCEGTEVVKIGNKDVFVKKKPIIYLYPEKEQEVHVKVNFEGKFTHTYPKYDRNTGWTVQASPDGTLIDPKTNKEYYALYWEGEHDLPYTTDKGFVVKGEHSATFLEEKCAQLGLSPREANEFIIYWLPQLESNPYNFIHFSLSEYQAQAPMEITPKPDALIRVFMLFKGLEEPMEVEEQILPAQPTRKGFTVVEWGGASMDKPLTKLK